MSSVVVDWRRNPRLPERGDPSAPSVWLPLSPSGLRCGRESLRPRNFEDPAASSAAESGDKESRCVCSAPTNEVGGASGDKNGRDPRRPVFPPVGIPAPNI